MTDEEKYDFFPDRVAETVTTLRLPDKADAMVTLAKQGHIKAFINFMEKGFMRVFQREQKNWTPKPHWMDNFKRCYEGARTCNQVSFQKVRWDKIAHRLLQYVEGKKRKNSDTRLCFTFDRVFLVKAFFTFGLKKVHKRMQHILQLTEAPMLCYVMDEDDTDSCTVHRCFQPEDEFRYSKFVLNPHQIYVVPPRTHYVLVTVQKTIFSLDIMRADVHVKDGIPCTTHRKFIQPAMYTLPPPTPIRELQAPVMQPPDEPVRELFPPPTEVVYEPSEMVYEPSEIVYEPSETCSIPQETCSIPQETCFVPPQTVPQETCFVPPETCFVAPQTCLVPPETVPSDPFSMPVLPDAEWNDFDDYLKSFVETLDKPSESLAFELMDTETFDFTTQFTAPEIFETQQTPQFTEPEILQQTPQLTAPEIFETPTEPLPPTDEQPMDLCLYPQKRVGRKRCMGFVPIYAMDLSVKRAKCR